MSLVHTGRLMGRPSISPETRPDDHHGIGSNVFRSGVVFLLHRAREEWRCCEYQGWTIETRQKD